MGVKLDNLSQQESVDYVVSCASSGEGGRVVNINVDVLRLMVADPAVHQVIADADLVLADGMPIMWASRLQGTPLKQRVSASEAIWPLCSEAASRGMGVFLLGAPPGTARRAGEVLVARYPGLVLAHHCPPFGFEHNDEATSEIYQAIEATGPKIVFCALGTPKAERFMKVLSGRFPALWFVTSGGTLSMVAGDTPKAPAWMSRSGLEWLHRLRLEPRRLFERYIVHDLPFVFHLLASSARARFSQ
jgi:N-acetylglucosaminyldiphosphoundecaprenol N-acetyl-beta-D-mannosaminyltransferase